MRRILMLILMAFLTSPLAAAPKSTGTVEAVVRVDPSSKIGRLEGTLFGINVLPSDKANIAKEEFIRRVKRLGFKSCRFPNGCVADRYDWKNPGSEATVEEFLEFCDAIGAEPYYTINMQGGTEGLQGPPPKDAPLDEIIKYRHTAPNPCGDTDYHFGTLAETLELVQKYTIDRALAGRRPILAYEMGNENWGQAKTDWPPEVYARTVEVYARAMRRLFEEAKNNHKQLSRYSLYIVAVGYPIMGNNMKETDTPERALNVTWTSLLNKLHSEGVIDAVQEHFYPHSSADGGSLVWTVHNLHNIILARKGKPNPRLQGYQDKDLAYRMPMEHTEWNIKCWGRRWSEDLQLESAGFEGTMIGWNASGTGVSVVPRAARRGTGGLHVESPCEVSQAFQCPENAKLLIAGVWVKTDKPRAFRLFFREPGKTEELGGWSSYMDGSWHRIVASAKVPTIVRRLELVLRVEEAASVDIDEVKVYYSTEESHLCPIGATTFEQQLFCVDALREMALGGCPRAHLHHLVGDYACGVTTKTGELKDLSKVFEFFNERYGTDLVNVDCQVEGYNYRSAANAIATDFNTIAPDQDGIPMLGCMASIRGSVLFLLLINRTANKQIEATIHLNAAPRGDIADVAVLSGDDIDLPGAHLAETVTKVARKFTQTIEPYSAQIISIKLR